MRTRKMAQRISNRIESDILSERLPVGHRLGTAAALLERYDVSGAVLREAIRLMERHRIVESRRGTGGGLFVSQRPRAAMARVLSGYLESAGLQLHELFEARRTIECATASFAAERVDHEGAEKLRKLVATREVFHSEGDEMAFHERFHTQVAESALSPALALFVQSLHQISQDIGRTTGSASDSANQHPGVWQAKRKIADAVIDGNSSVARKLMNEHLHERERRLARKKSRRRSDREAELPPKLAESLAREITEEIRRKRWVPGTRIGFEPELVDTYGVSRAIFREAVRMLEQHGVAEMRLGGRGGLFVSDADPSEVVLSASVYLAHLDIKLRSLYEARTTLESEAAALAAERASKSDRLRLATALGRTLSCDPNEMAEAALDVHQLIAELSGNRAISLFIRVLIKTARANPAAARRPKGWQDAFQGTYIRLVSAIHDRDSDSARALMEKHLALKRGW